jgi:hypothetical protein
MKEFDDNGCGDKPYKVITTLQLSTIQLRKISYIHRHTFSLKLRRKINKFTLLYTGA